MTNAETSPTNTDAAALLREGLAAAKAGDRERARELLTRVVRLDDRNVTAWLWLSGVVDDLNHRELCLQTALRLDPQNEAVQRGLGQSRLEVGADRRPPRRRRHVEGRIGCDEGLEMA